MSCKRKEIHGMKFFIFIFEGKTKKLKQKKQKTTKKNPPNYCLKKGMENNAVLREEKVLNQYQT